MRDPVVLDRLRHETRESRPVPHMPPEAFTEAAEDTIANWLDSDMADQIRDASDTEVAALFRFAVNIVRPDLLMLGDMDANAAEVIVRGMFRRIVNEQSALAQEDWEARS